MKTGLSILLIMHLNIAFMPHERCFIYPPSIFQQRQQDSPFYVESWKKGNRTIREQSFSASLTSKNRDFRVDIEDSSKEKRYSLFIKHNPAKSEGIQYESWDVKLYEMIDLQHNLFLPEKPDGWQHHFPKENSIAWLFPIEDPDYLKYGVAAYPFSAKRVIKIESFYCALQVISYKRNDANPKSLDSLTVQIEFTNSPPLVK